VRTLETKILSNEALYNLYSSLNTVKASNQGRLDRRDM